MSQAAEQGRRFEKAVADHFERNGYTTRCNVIREGRSGGRHEVDVLAEKADALTTFQVAIECKAWQRPINKEVVVKLRHVVDDLGLDKGIIVSLGGITSGAELAATDRGIDLWGPDELRSLLGASTVLRLGVPPEATSSTLVRGLEFAWPEQGAERSIRSSGKGLFRTVEELRFFSRVWLPVHSVHLTVVRPVGRGSQSRSIGFTSIYEALNGAYLGPVGTWWEQIRVDRDLTLPPLIRGTAVEASLRKAFQGYSRVTSPAAVERHSRNLAELGIYTPCSSLSVDRTDLAYLPYYVGVLVDKGRHQRVVAVDGGSGTQAEIVSKVLTANLPQLRAHFST